jgi:hypothetical protein
MLIIAAGLGLLFVPMSLVSLTRRNADTGGGLQPAQRRPAGRRLDRAGASGHRRVERGGDNLRSQAAAAAKAGGHPLTAAIQKQIADHALATGFSHGYLVSAAIGLLALIITLAAIRVTRQDLVGVEPVAAPVG